MNEAIQPTELNLLYGPAMMVVGVAAVFLGLRDTGEHLKLTGQGPPPIVLDDETIENMCSIGEQTGQRIYIDQCTIQRTYQNKETGPTEEPISDAEKVIATVGFALIAAGGFLVFSTE